MKLFIIGNGFDKAHGLPTSYWDFRTFLENRFPDFLYAFEQLYNIYPGLDDSSKRNLLWNEFETNLANIDEDVIIEQAISIEMSLESGDIGIEDTLDEIFKEEYGFIHELAIYLKQWVRTIRIRDLRRKTSMINGKNDAIYINFNYTAVLETTYKIPEDNIIHIHGSLREKFGEPILGHGNKTRIEKILERQEVSERLFNEKESSILKAIYGYYLGTYKDINKFMHRLRPLTSKEVEQIFVVGHSLAGVDMPYFRYIDFLTSRKASWKIYYLNECDIEQMKANLISVGIDKARIDMAQSNKFFDLE